VNRRKIPLIGAGVGVLLIAAFWFLVYQPRAEALAAVRDETAQIETLQQQARNQITALEEVRANEADIRAAIKSLDGYVPQGVAQPQLVRQLQETADAAGVEIRTLTFGTPEPLADAPATGDEGTVLGAIPVNATIEGGYFQTIDFFHRLETHVPRAVLVLDIAVNEGSEDFPMVATSWGGRTFAIVPAPAGEAPQPGVDAPADGQAPADAQAPGDGQAPADAPPGDAPLQAQDSPEAAGSTEAQQ
jgi:Tfp pilus assembly protein PilO